MGWSSYLIKLDGSQEVLRSNSRSHLQRLRADRCSKLLKQVVYASPMIRDGKVFIPPMITKTQVKV